MLLANLVLALIVQNPAPSPAPAPPAPLDWTAADSANIALLTTQGRSLRRRHVVVWAPNDSLEARWLDAFADSLDAGVGRLKALAGSHDWQRLGDRPVVYYFAPGRFVSHGSGRGDVFISLTRIRAGGAPYLHEAAHEILATRMPFFPFEHSDSVAAERAGAGFPLWLSEGLPDVLAQTVADEIGFAEGDVFSIGGLARADSVCGARLAASPRREEIVAKVGGAGRLMALFTTERAAVAPVFYACSQSFTWWLVRRVGLPAMVAVIPRVPPGTWQEAISDAAGQPLENLRRQWLRGLEP